MPRIIRNDWSLRKLLLATYSLKRNRFDNMDRDVLKRISIKKVLVYDGKAPGEARTTYHIVSSSYPQYYPYKTKTDSRGRTHTVQRKYKHQYDVVISMDKLSMDAPVKLRTGSDCHWDFTSKEKIIRDSKKKIIKIIESKNTLKGRNGDFFFRLEYIYAQEGILYGRNWTNGPPIQTNPSMIPFLDKHMIRCVETLMKAGVFGAV